MSNPDITIIGRLAVDPEFKVFGSNTAVKFRVVTSDRRKNEDGNWVDINTSGWNVVAWNGLADSCKNVLAKGQEVMIVGSIKEDSWTDKEGNPRKSVEVSANKIAITTYEVQRTAKNKVLENSMGSGPYSWD